VRAAAGALAVIASLAFADCGSPAPPSTARTAPAEPRWEDVLDVTPELLAVVFPLALRRDAVYGPLLRHVIDLVREQSHVVAETRALDAMEDAEEVIVGVRPEAGVGPPGSGASAAVGEMIVVVRGVRAEVDPATLVDADGHPLWAPGPSGGVRELVPRDDPSSPDDAGAPVPASLFELPGRTWVIASGNARARARVVFAHPLGRPSLRLEADNADALLVLRIDGPSLVARVRALQPPAGLAAIGRRLGAVTLVLAGSTLSELGRGDQDVAAPDAGPEAGLAHLRRSVRASLAYADADAATLAEATVRDVLGAIARKKPDDLAWLGNASVDRPSPGGSPGNSVVVTAPLPPRLVGALLHAAAAKLQTGPPPP
jgi:hypothetical protein